MHLIMRSLLSVIVSVLNNEQNIPELPDDQLVAFQNKGQPITGSINGTAFNQIARLQTLIVQEQEKAQLPEIATLKAIGAESRQDFGSTMASALSVQEDTTQNIIMLERLIVAIVRDACPSESERLGVRYVADISLRIFFAEAPQRRFLD